MFLCIHISPLPPARVSPPSIVPYGAIHGYIYPAQTLEWLGLAFVSYSFDVTQPASGVGICSDTRTE